MQTAPPLEELVERLLAATVNLDNKDQRVAIGLIRQLGEGDPVKPAALARTLGLGERQIEDALDRLPGVQFDDEERAVAYFGLSVIQTGPHRIHVGDRTLSAWCAWDTLFLPELLGRTVRVTSRSPIGGEEISLTVTADGVTDVNPSGTVVSFLLPQANFGHRTIESFCRSVHFFASPADAAAYTAQHPDTFVLPLEDAFELGLIVNRAVFGAAIPTQPA